MQVVLRLALCAFLAVLSAMMMGITSAAVSIPDPHPRHPPGSNGDTKCATLWQC
ncbi:hypothetical protein Pst134EA_027700 [Puccinia striiformis f. sp. tritici]|uniref:hypothetical protein n=1 Tax=Puccinia striiformis f. sp. tritici TaxID=168172 RepID=UPI0020077501|nr:hypothetical protein Pst134EA_027700 [Puccinia striiformis f. sp. tritici]KAH9448388.1 hypothetical protein Pst134EA_027700 [Puccinia striiformis f. sp. tritici]